ncbi:MAG: DUF222 domain-containing protein [Deltaproteobacteria bacterium]|nr:DUF222 domain-containing protein [Deltaproteobacteria bacterium]
MSRETERIGDEIAELAAHLEAAEYRLISKLAEFDARGGWSHQGAISCAHWLSWRIGLGLGPAREKVRVARVLPLLPKIAAAFREARISYSKVRAITRVATPENEALLVEMAVSATASILEKICRKFRSVVEIERDRETPAEADARRTVRYQHLPDGRMRFTADLPADEGARFLAALDRAVIDSAVTDRAVTDRAVVDRAVVDRAVVDRAVVDRAVVDRAVVDRAVTDRAVTDRAVTDRAVLDSAGATDASAETSPIAEKRRPTRADGLMLMTESFLAEGPRPRAGGTPCEVRLHVTKEELEEKLEGAFLDNADTTGVSAETSRRLSCDAAVVRVTDDADGRVLDIGRRTRTVPAALRRALEVRDHRQCCFPGCTHALFLDAHHLQHWADGGATRLDNLILLCTRHHKFVHEYGYRVELGADGKPIFSAPGLRPLPRVWMPPPCPSDAVEALAEAHDAAGLDLTPLTLLPAHWDGEPTDYPMVIDALCARTFPRRSAHASEEREVTPLA